jgi:hypothetical protein
MRPWVPARCERGQTTGEYAGVIVLVAAAVLVVAAFAPGIAGAIADAVHAALCRVSGTGCGTGEVAAPANPYLPDEPCVRSNASKKAEAQVTAFSITGGVSVEGRREARADGSVAVTLQGSGNAGVEFVLGGKGGVNTGGGSYGGGASAEGSLVGELTGARTWIFDTPAEADEFIDDVKSFLIDNAVAEGIGSVPGGGFLAEWAYRQFIADHDNFDFPQAEETYFSGGIELEASAGAGAGLAYADVEGIAEAALGGSFNSRTGQTTLFYEIALEGEGSAGINLAAGGEGGGRGTVMVALTLDEHGNPSSLELVGTGEGSLDLESVGRWENLDDLTDGLASATVEGSAGDTHTWEAAAELPLEDPASERVALEWLASHLLGPTNPRFIAASIGLARALNQQGIITIMEYDGQTSGITAEGKLGGGVAFGGSGGYEETEAELVSAKYREPGHGFIDIPGCMG